MPSTSPRRTLRSSKRSSTVACGHPAIHFDPSADRDLPCRVCWENREVLIQRLLHSFEEAFAAISVESPREVRASGPSTESSALVSEGTAEDTVRSDQEGRGNEGDTIRVSGPSELPAEYATCSLSLPAAAEPASPDMAHTSRTDQSGVGEPIKSPERRILKPVRPSEKHRERSQATLFSFFMPTPAQSESGKEALAPAAPVSVNPASRARSARGTPSPARVRRMSAEKKEVRGTALKLEDKSTVRRPFRRSTRERKGSAVSYHENSD